MVDLADMLAMVNTALNILHATELKNLPTSVVVGQINPALILIVFAMFVTVISVVVIVITIMVLIIAKTRHQSVIAMFPASMISSVVAVASVSTMLVPSTLHFVRFSTFEGMRF